MASLELKIPPLLVVAIIAGLMALTAWLMPMGPWHFTDATGLALGLFIAGLLIALAGVIGFRRARTTVNPMQPETSRVLVQTGIYRFTRNPMYLGFLLMLAGYGVWLANLPALVWLIGYVLYLTQFQIIPEERWLTQKFGDEFLRYRQHVRRWF
ncbi:Protein-S-isoprenylcysteine O-methyltransferase Ste14 [Pseudidiomarina indica]|uniref:Protein-S-isoprenylcysteine O-methyltransferase Ste14 n=1 Tax=Pseudidiomarina indica TaxID=1159017 RepID=A0A1G6E3I3_9GAMM|nr:isoprenylcysteine carboxylmethyltransferase family protein [Pseudidiomarina indica]SDB52004.1 Protein-S-isoprenylcysteine O-methyltransferase Ste14 [Pseudidiomarina indica]